eukprot:CAMPEP_0198111092 /NCGR_PEP_ID=MMETSP1442-20131203/3076_1 /TAXON_ID= /ORGANISM="Craspedostauros australis, Strain CCMP3328" /LENGTH=248 /DNA_ID=CAMNT_0043767399 /DNA_START=184 /DNA_END=927 /DNA_ORIENTATION=-
MLRGSPTRIIKAKEDTDLGVGVGVSASCGVRIEACLAAAASHETVGADERVVGTHLGWDAAGELGAKEVHGSQCWDAGELDWDGAPGLGELHAERLQLRQHSELRGELAGQGRRVDLEVGEARHQTDGRWDWSGEAHVVVAGVVGVKAEDDQVGEVADVFWDGVGEEVVGQIKKNESDEVGEVLWETTDELVVGQIEHLEVHHVAQGIRDGTSDAVGSEGELADVDQISNALWDVAGQVIFAHIDHFQ